MKKMILLLISVLLYSDVNIDDISTHSIENTLNDKLIYNSDYSRLTGTLKWANEYLSISKAYLHTYTGSQIARKNLSIDKRRDNRKLTSCKIKTSTLPNMIAKLVLTKGMQWVKKTHLSPMKLKSLSKKQKLRLKSEAKKMARLAYSIVALARDSSKGATVWVIRSKLMVKLNGYVVVLNAETGHLISLYKSDRPVKGKDYLAGYYVRKWQGRTFPKKFVKAYYPKNNKPSFRELRNIVQTPITWSLYVRAINQ